MMAKMMKRTITLMMMATMMKRTIMLMMMAYDCRVRNMNCFGAKAASANSVAHLAHDNDDDDHGGDDDIDDVFRW